MIMMMFIGQIPVYFNDVGLLVRVLIASNGGSDVAGHSRVSMRQLATSRMALELEREKERELDLRRLGCISTISEERRPHNPSEEHVGCLTNGHVTGGGAWLIEREVQVAKERELELQCVADNLLIYCMPSDKLRQTGKPTDTRNSIN